MQDIIKKKLLSQSFVTHHVYALSKMRCHGEIVYSQLEGFQGHCHICEHRSGCGIIAKCRPFAEQIPAMPSVINHKYYIDHRINCI